MPRYVHKKIEGGDASWDADIDKNFENIFEKVFPVPNGPVASPWTDSSQFPSAAQNAGCLAAVSGVIWELWWSNGLVWLKIK